VGDSRAYLFDGAAGGLLRTFESPQPLTDGRFGNCVAGLADVNGNGAGDVLITATGEPSGCVEFVGRVYLFDGATGELLHRFETIGPHSFEAFGFTVFPTPDTNGDARPDILIAAFNKTVNDVAAAGEVYLFQSPLLEAGAGGTDLEDCRDACGNGGEDADGDGLSGCIETCLGTSDAAVDSDFDGMPDNFEAQFGLDLAADDSAEDPDGDGVLNLEEYLRNASPLDARDPSPTFFVRIDGVDDPAGGSIDQPWATITFALSQVDGTAARPARILLLCGEYEEDITLKPFVSVEGKPEETVQILGTVQGAPNSALANLVLASAAGAPVLLTVVDANARIQNVEFTGVGTETGILAQGAGSTGMVIDQCRFTGLAVGLEMDDASPTVRRCFFEACGEAGILVRAAAGKGLAGKSLGDQSDPTSGWNTFQDNPTLNVKNEGEVPITAEFNDWGTDSAEAIANSISGPSDFEPFLPAGKGILAASLFCTVWDDENQKRILNASVSLRPSGYPAVTENVEGLYAFPAIPSGTYDLSVESNGFTEATDSITLADSETLSITVPLNSTGGGGGLFDCPNRKGTVAPGDLAVLALVVAGMVSVWKISRL
ncbi:MAG: carboxypeptidase regulatory-like domain-containing protein, partial [Candidatus Hydrogenedentes bacterium]|nr:carboxypeptidase regulatory-like domain-containing protein [Candidatus Hydrogenedentota bacterium]